MILLEMRLLVSKSAQLLGQVIETHQQNQIEDQAMMQE